MKRPSIRLLAVFFLLLTIAITPIALFYARYEALTDHLEQDLEFEGSAANAVKHAYAAAQLYSALNIALNDQRAEEAVMSLGIMNEYIERVAKFRKPDSLREVMKDLHNNQAGILAARWQKQKHGERGMLDMIISMARDKTLVIKRTENPFYKGEDRTAFSVVREALTWLSLYRSDISNRVREGLEHNQHQDQAHLMR